MSSPRNTGEYPADTVHALRDRVGELETEVADLRARLRRAENSAEALRLSEEKFSAAFRASPDAMSITQLRDGRFLDVNAAFERVFGVSKTDTVGHTSLELGLWADAADRESLVQRVRAGQTIRNVEYRFRRSTGETFHVLYSGERLKIGGRFCLLSVLTDITELKRIEQALRDSREHLLQIVEGTTIPTYIIAPDHTISHWNKACELLVGFPAEEMVGTSRQWMPFYGSPRPTMADLLVDGCDESELLKYYGTKRLRKSPATGAYEAEDFFSGLGEKGKWAFFTAAPLRDNDGRIIGAVETFQDITERKELEAQLHQAHKLEAVGQLASGVAHDFNNLLTIIFANLDELKRAGDDPATREESIGMIRSASEQAVGVTRSLLTFSRRMPTEKMPVELRSIVDKTVRMLKRMLPASIEIDADRKPAEPVYVNADPTQIQQILMNLAINARDAMPDGGRLSIAVGRDAPGHVRLTMTDTGTGMPDDVRSRVFEPFFTTKPREQGTGLGLSIIHGIVKSHGGAIDVTSEVDKGTTFRILLPALEVGQARADRPDEDTMPRGHNERILLAEDNEALLRTMTGSLESLGYEVVQAGDGQALLDAWHREKETLRLIIADVDMPRRSGLDCVRTIREAGSRMPIILTSGTIDVDMEPRIDDSVVLLRKPFRVTTLAAHISELLRLHSAESES